MPSAIHFLKRLQKRPSTKGWLESIGYAVLVMLLVLVIDPSVVQMAQQPTITELIKISAIAFFIPSLTEELIFRGLLLPKFSTTWLLLSLTGYVLWHPLEALTFLPESATYFLDLQFLLLIAILGIFCTIACRRTGSLWASVLVHWLVVVAWKAVGGARFLA